MRHFIWVARKALSPGDAFSMTEGHGTAFILNGDVKTASASIPEGSGTFLEPKAEISNDSLKRVEMLVFGVSKKRPDLDLLALEELDDLAFPALLRLDEVSFPPGAIAYRHTHPGPGFRYLRFGALHLQADDHAFDANPGHVWFEAANSPVKATASSLHEETRFVRFMVLPTAFEGKPTINILDPEEAARPKKQSTHRHVDQIVESDDQDDAG